ncbi:hypothetical protein DFQ05_0636 [Winogradskyella wandonensis]|uniref:Uncharacterized protein n=1 Tax=Winogradskyella wandonensis TaxID=1442586 RepID=A0A4V2PU59_9FLAO|nr:hypothetical protein [Winogradskyella wandonensis]TCK69121.1 hypothetical protein DFQ05_0636 [Winogradskyella wandonensis]
MREIKIIFFAIGTFFGIENSSIFSVTTTVNIDTKQRIISITQENLFALSRSAEDSINIYNQLLKIGRPKDEVPSWRDEFKDYEFKTIELISDKNNNQLNAKIQLKYNHQKQLEDYAIDYVSDSNEYALINIDSWNISTEKGSLKENFWYFDSDISFTLSPTKTMPEAYKIHKTSLYNYWEKIKQ